MHSGIVKWFNGSQGYGFIKEEDGLRDVFVQYSDVISAGCVSRRALKEGDRVYFDIEQSVIGPTAVNVSLT